MNPRPSHDKSPGGVNPPALKALNARGWRSRSPSAIVELLSFLAEHRLALPAHVAALLGTSAAAATTRLGKLASAGYLKRHDAFQGQPRWYQITRKGLALIGSPLPPPRVDLRDVPARRRRRVAVARRPRRDVRPARRDHRRAPASLASTASREPGRRAARGAGSAGSAPTDSERLHYPDLVLRTADGRRVALELELTPKSRDPPREDPRRLRRRSPVRRRRVPRRAAGRRAVGPGARRGGSASRTSSTSSGSARPCPDRRRRPRSTAERAAASRRRDRRARGGQMTPRRTGAPRCAVPDARRVRRADPRCPRAVAAGAVAAMLAFSAARGALRLARRRSRRAAAQARSCSASTPRGRLVRLGDDELSAHGLILGASGAGKTTTLLTILTDQVRRGPAGRGDRHEGLAGVRARARRGGGRRGTPVHGLDASTAPAHWNPLAHGNATELKDKLIGDRALHRAALPARRRALRPDRPPGARAGPSRPAADAARGRGR